MSDLLELATMVATISTREEVNTIKQQIINQTERERYLDELRNRIFQLKREAEAAYDQRSQDPIGSTATLFFVLMAFQNKEFNAYNLPSFIDKEYVHQTIKWVELTLAQVVADLDPTQRWTVRKTVSDILGLQNIYYYLCHYKVHKQYLQNLDTLNRQRIGVTKHPLAHSVFFFIVCFMTAGVPVLILNLQETDAVFFWLFIAAISSFIAAYLFYSSMKRNIEESNQPLANLPSSFDITRYNHLRSQYGDDYPAIRQRYDFVVGMLHSKVGE